MALTIPTSTSKPTDTLLFHIMAKRLPAPETEVQFYPHRKWRFDLFWREQNLAVEVMGGAHGSKATGGRRGKHHRPDGYRQDCEKKSFAMMLSYRVLYVTPEQIDSGEAVQWIEALLRGYFIDTTPPKPKNIMRKVGKAGKKKKGKRKKA